MRQCLAVAVFVLILAVSMSASATVSSAAGVVHSKTTNYAGQWLKVERPDGSKLNALCHDSDPDEGYISYECATSNIGEPVFGEAVLSGGSYTWTCIDVQSTSCTSWTFPIITGTIVRKESCAGELYVTVRRSDGAEVIGHCEGAGVVSECQSLQINQSVTAYLAFGCYVDKDWIDFQ